VSKDYFGERIAERYDETASDMFDPSAVNPVVDFLADLASTVPRWNSASVPAGLRYR
jgi:hypothetical protein